MTSPYSGLSSADWLAKTEELVAAHPLQTAAIRATVEGAWSDIFASQIGRSGYKIGVHFFPRPQIIGYLFHELIAADLAKAYPGVWRREETVNEKDLVYLLDAKYSIEVKTSNSAGIYGNRSTTQARASGAKPKKDKSGYLIAVNFQGFRVSAQPKVTRIRFGWLDETDWQGQKAATGQMASIIKDAVKFKLLDI